MRKIAVITDSTAVIEKSILENNENLYSIPLHIIFGDKSYRDGIDISVGDFFNRVSNSSSLPTTSQPSVGEVIDLFEELMKKYDHLIYITISSKISGTYQNGLLGKNEVSDRITVFDSLITSVVQKQMVIETLDMINENNGIEDILGNLKRIRTNSNVLLVVNDLKHLNRTGRISFAAASIGNMLKLKPVLEFDNGKIVVRKKIRTVTKAYKHVVEIIKDKDLSSTSKIMIAHADGYESALSLQKELNLLYPNHEITISELSPVISLHTGPNTVGLAWIK
ncbi:DegV family protein [Mycoplasmatota bacterium]|nr:DegV family protein [Mycoplasmatota bacterium]